MKKILVELAEAALPKYEGVTVENRKLFEIWSKSKAVDTYGLLWGLWEWPNKSIKSLEEQAIFLGFLNEEVAYKNRVTGGINETEKQIEEYYPLERLRSAFPTDIIWRKIFSKSCSASFRKTLSSRKFYLTTLGISRTVASFESQIPTLGTEGFDIAFFEFPRAVDVSKNTKKLVRFHDCVHITAPDTVSSPNAISSYLRTIKAIEKESIFVCDSPQSKHELSLISPLAAARSAVIPAIGSSRTIQQHEIENRTSKIFRVRCANTKNLQYIPKDENPDYILSVSTLQPRKNFSNLIKGWQQFISRTGKDIKLVLVANAGWRSGTILQEMEPYIAQGSLIHLSNLSDQELGILYANARAYISTSYTEGFGMPLVEASQFGIPVICSDIEVFHYVLQDAGYYCDQYDIDSISKSIEQVLSLAPSELSVLKGKLIENAKRFSVESVEKQWIDIFNAV